MRKVIPGLVVLVASLAFGLWAWERLPAEVATHWSLSGEPDGWSSRTTGVLLTPAIGLGLALLLTVFPRIDPRRDSYALHGPTYWTVANASLVFLGAVHAAMIGYNLGWPLRMDMLVGIGAGALFILLGNLMTRMRPNWFMGIRTPWTLSSEQVWRKTHRVGGYGFVAAGVVMATAGLLRSGAFAVIALAAVGAAAVVPIVYSYFAWREEHESPKSPARG